MTSLPAMAGIAGPLRTRHVLTMRFIDARLALELRQTRTPQQVSRLNPRESATSEFYDGFWQREDESNRINPVTLHRFRLVLQELNLLEIPPEMLLDVGCGSGALAQGAQGFPASTSVGHGRFQVAAELATRAAEQIFVHDLAAAPFVGVGSLRFDAVTMTERPEHLRQPVALLKNLRPLLAENATVVVTLPTVPMTPYDRMIGHVQHMTLNELRLRCAQAGYETIRAYRWGFPFHSLYRITVGLLGENASSHVPTKRGSLGYLALSIMNASFYCNLKSRNLGRHSSR